MSTRIMVFGDGVNFAADISRVDAMGFQKKTQCPADEQKEPQFFITINGIMYTNVAKILIGTHNHTIKYEPQNFEKLIDDFMIDLFIQAE